MFIDMLTQAENLIYETEKNIKENGEKFDDAEKANLNDKLSILKKSKESGNLEDIKSSMEGLNSTWSAMAAKMHESTNQQPGSDSNKKTTKESSKSKNKENEIEDADFEVVD